MQPLGDTLRAIRRTQMLTQADLARLLGVNVTTISLWEHGHHEPRASHKRKIRALYGIEVSNENR